MNVTGKTVGVNGMTGMRGTYLTRRGFVRLAGAAAAGAALGGAVLPLSGCAPAGDVLRVGTKIDVPGFGFQNPETGSVGGLEGGRGPRARRADQGRSQRARRLWA